MISIVGRALANVILALSLLLAAAGLFASYAAAKESDSEIAQSVKEEEEAFGDFYKSLVESAEQPTSMPDMALGSATAPVTIFYYASLNCDDTCKRNLQTVKTQYVDTGKARLIIRMTAFDVPSTAAEMFARCTASGDAVKYYTTFLTLIGEAASLKTDPFNTLIRNGTQTGMGLQAVKACLTDQTVLTKIAADTNFAKTKLIVDDLNTSNVLVTGANFYDTDSMGFFDFDRLDWRLRSGQAHGAPPAQSPPVLIFFDSQSSALTSAAKAIVPAIKDRIGKSSRIAIVGHCDTSETDAGALSLARAEEVKKSLVALGAPKGAAITVAGNGATEPLAPTGPHVSDPRNRYVSITIE